MVKRAACLFLAAGLCLSGIPVRAAQALPNTVSGVVPGGVEGVASVVLQDASGKSVLMTPPSEGRFVFRDVAPGEYFVALFGASGQRIARSCSVAVATGTQREAVFDCPVPAAAPAPSAATEPPSATAAGGKMGTTGWVLVGAAAIGITTAVVIATNEDEGPASPAR